ncbi:MAG: hypothetical protein Kow00124_32340 [Anaerolineae bacterium]
MLGGERLIRLYREYLLSELNKPDITPRRRMHIGDWLDTLGDTRPGVGLLPDGLPDIEWCPVPGGYIQVANEPEPFEVRHLWIARYPVTWAQYRIFLEAPDGHESPLWWDGLLRRPEYPREVILRDNQPAQEVSWYDAVAYCRWLSYRIGFEVRLPTEWEWEMAASGGIATNHYPWGPQWIENQANTRESLLRRSLAVGLYPHAPSPVGALDMSGNVLEWCQNEYFNPAATDPGPAKRAYRGGSWFLIYEAARVTWRSGNDPYMRYNSVGFRLVTDDPYHVPRPAPPAIITAEEYPGEEHDAAAPPVEEGPPPPEDVIPLPDGMADVDA